MVILIFMVITIPISMLDPSTGEFRFILPYFYAGIAGVVIIVLYSSYTERKERQKANAKRRSKK